MFRIHISYSSENSQQLLRLQLFLLIYSQQFWSRCSYPVLDSGLSLPLNPPPKPELIWHDFVFRMWVWIWANNHKQKAPGRKISRSDYFLHLPLRVIKQISMPAWPGKHLSQVETSCLEKTRRGFGDFIYLFCFCLFLFDIMPSISLERTVTVYSKRGGKNLLTKILVLAFNYVGLFLSIK